MGNCQAIEAAAFVIQHPNGRIERFYWPVTASEVMRMNPGHYVSLIIPLPSDSSKEDKNNQQEEEEDQKKVRFTRVHLLRPSDTLALGHAYRLVTSQEVMKVLRAKKHAKTKRQQQESSVVNLQEKPSSAAETEQKPGKENTNEGMRHERHRPRTIQVNQAAMRSKSWRPSLQSISEAVS